jgi:hypothetical protein
LKTTERIVDLSFCDSRTRILVHKLNGDVTATAVDVALQRHISDLTIILDATTRALKGNPRIVDGSTQ